MFCLYSQHPACIANSYDVIGHLARVPQDLKVTMEHVKAKPQWGLLCSMILWKVTPYASVIQSEVTHLLICEYLTSIDHIRTQANEW